MLEVTFIIGNYTYVRHVWTFKSYIITGKCRFDTFFLVGQGRINNSGKKHLLGGICAVKLN